MIVQVSYENDGHSKLVPTLLDMLESGELCNFTIKSGTRSVKAHKCVLAATLEHFRTSFRFSEASSNESSIDLSHLNCDITIVQRVIQSLYSNEIEIHQNQVEGILHLADYLLYKDLTVCVERFMENTLGLNNAIFFFKLCIQFNLRSTSLFGNIRRILRGRFHDFMIHDAGNLKLDMDIFSAMYNYGLLDNCSPLQLMKFFLKKLLHDLTSKQSQQEEKFLNVVSFLEWALPLGHDPLRECWRPYLKDYLTDWLHMHGNTLEHNTNLLDRLLLLANRFSCQHDMNFESAEDKNTLNTPDSSQKNNTDSPVSLSAKEDDSSKNSDVENHSLSLIASSSKPSDDSTTHKSMDNKSLSSTKLILSSSQMSPTPAQMRETENDSQNSIQRPSSIEPALANSQDMIVTDSKCYRGCQTSIDELCQTLVVLAPSSDMASQLMEVEVGKMRPLLKAPKLCLHLYDTRLRMWKEGISLDFPIPGYMLEKHAWRVSFANENLYLFSLGKQIGLEYSLQNSAWTHLSCDEIFKAHSNFSNEEFPVKSIIPVSIGDQLVILSMSREPRPDGSFWTQQHIYQFEQLTKTFSHISVVRDERMDLPITKWTVKDDELFTLKASTVMYRNLHVYNVQHIHVYNAKLRQLKTHHIQSAMKSGLKVLVQAGTLYLLNNLGEYQQLDLTTSTLSEWQMISNPAFTTVNSSVNDTDRDEIYPALLRTTCHAGCSRWTLSAQDNIGSASLQEMYVTKGGEFNIGHHPSPPFLHLTAMCVGKIKQSFLDKMKQAQFDPSLLHTGAQLQV